MIFAMFEQRRGRARMAAFLTGLALTLSTPAHADDDGEGEEQEALFLIEEAYTQEDGEWQIGLELEQSLDQTSEREWEVEIEYGITDRLQAEVEFELEQDGGNSEIGDIALGLSYALVEAAGSSGPEVTAGAAALIPSGDGGMQSNGIGFALSLRASQQWAEGVFGHAELGYQESPEETVAGATIEKSEWSAGTGLAVALAENSFLIGEYVFSREKESTAAFTIRESTHTASLGITFEPVDDLVFGLGAGQSFADSDETTLIAFAQIEF